MKNILITGGFGFLGSHLVDLLYSPETEIYIVDDLSSNVVNPKLFTANRKIQYSTQNTQSFLSALKDYDPYKFNEVYHLASIVGPAGVLPHAGRIAKEIINDTYEVMQYCRKNKSKLVFVSTSEVYGGGQDGYCSEEMDCIIAPDSSARLEYALGKLASEIALINQVKVSESSSSHMFNLNAVIVRPFNIAGARQSGGGGFVLPRFIKACQDNKPVTVFGDGSQIRAFTDVRDVAKGLYLAMLKGKNGEIYNIGSNLNRTSIKNFAEIVKTFYPENDIKTQFVDPREIFGPDYAEANDKYPNSEKAEAELGWRPQYDLEEIIRSAVEDRKNR